MVNKTDRFLEVTTRTTRTARHRDRMPVQGTEGKDLRLRFAIEAEARATVRPKRHPPEYCWLAPSRRPIAEPPWLLPPEVLPAGFANNFRTGTDPHG